MPLTKFNVVKMEGHRFLAALESHNANVAKDFTNVIKTFHRDLKVLSRAKHSERLFSEIQGVYFVLPLVSVKMVLAKSSWSLDIGNCLHTLRLGYCSLPTLESSAMSPYSLVYHIAIPTKGPASALSNNRDLGI